MSSITAAVPLPGPQFQVDGLERLTYLIAGGAMAAMVCVGFHQFYLHGLNALGKPVTRQIAGLVYIHGTLMTGWIIFFIVQSSLIVRGNRSLHMKLGAAGVVLYALIVAVGTVTALLSTHYNPAGAHPPWGPQRFLTVPLTAIYGFAVLAGIALLYRRKRGVHRPMMLLGTLFAVSAGIARIGAIRQPFFQASHGSLFTTYWMPPIIAAVLVGLLKLALTRRWDRYYATGLAIMVFIAAAGAYISTTGWWLQLAYLVRR
jgi:hypothetical protein